MENPNTSCNNWKIKFCFMSYASRWDFHCFTSQPQKNKKEIIMFPRLNNGAFRGFNSGIPFLEKGITTSVMVIRKASLYSFWISRFNKKWSIQLKLDYKDKTDSNFNFSQDHMKKFWREETLISWKVHSKHFPYAKRCNTNWNRWLNQR